MAERSASLRRPSVLPTSPALLNLSSRPLNNPSNDHQPRQIAHALADLLSEMGIPAFVFQPFQDTAVRQ